MFLVESEAAVMVGIILQSSRTPEKEEGSQLFSSQNKWLLCSRKVEIFSDATARKGKIWQESNNYNDIQYLYSSNTPYHMCRPYSAFLLNLKLKKSVHCSLN